MKLELIRWLEKLEDKRILESLFFFKIISQEKDWWDELSPSQQQQVEQGLAEANEGKLISSEKLWERYGRKPKRRMG